MYITPNIGPMVCRAYCSSRGEIMPKVDVSKEYVQSAQLNYMKILEKENSDRVAKLLKTRSRNRYTALGLGIFVICIYAYSINSVKQEHFLDELDES
ncbi:cytochrome c oxidase assembly factor 3, mitochondrial-like [Varroa jacobsoni]|uniref:Cytochrome c oxidase assembly factor 3 n=1 Tax=Varroa destructor TaxID=109461 RepID=A0A7M7K562_VARDE|nr:cytochrome c oxidase assembly factor 3, mitochondrial-like [Varroa destructor]XP_022711468.1 cytochrome c oxidase assembly factor 3, mitochondrial-like [Varroa jacobsoni]